MDCHYNYMYELNKGSYFGEMHVMFGLRSDNFFSVCKFDNRKENILFKITGYKFLEVIV